MRSLFPHRPSRSLGFTAIELTAVAAIIALLALVLIPIVRKRVDESRFVAAADDMKTIETAQVLANADVGKYFRLCDLDNGPADADILKTSTNTTDLERAMASVPRAYWNEVNSLIFGTTGGSAKGTQVVLQWKGPYTTFNKSKYVLVSGLRPTMIRKVSTAGTSNSGAEDGPILVLDGTADADKDSPPFTSQEKQEEVHPIDPWGSPYLFFGPGRINTPTGGRPAITAANETNFGTAVVFSLGPDGLPGNNAADISVNYYRETGYIGSGDDLQRVF